MKAIKFEQANIMLAESQEEYETLPIWMADASGNLSMQKRDIMG